MQDYINWFWVYGSNSTSSMSSIILKDTDKIANEKSFMNDFGDVSAYAKNVK